ncbi:MAG TPA: hypothetical protein VM619_14735 [Luteimonas sp.]|nr:hypothetical protein [Luteimonas sp.]
MADAAATPETMGFREFADHLGKKPSYVTELKRKGHLVLTDDGRRVAVAESKQLIADSMDPAKAGVVARHAAQRAARRAPSSTASPKAAAAPVAAHAPPADADVADQDSDGEGTAGGDTPAAAPADPIARQRAEEQLAQERLKRRALERTEAKELGLLLERESTVSALANFVTVLRNRLQGLPARLAPELGASDETRCKVLLADEIEHALEDLERKFNSIGKEK